MLSERTDYNDLLCLFFHYKPLSRNKQYAIKKSPVIGNTYLLYLRLKGSWIIITEVTSYKRNE